MAARWPGTFNLAEFLEAAKIPSPQLAILQSSQGACATNALSMGDGVACCRRRLPHRAACCFSAAWQSVERGDELQSVPRTSGPVQQQQQEIHQVAVAQPRRPAIQHAMQLFDGLIEPSGAATIATAGTAAAGAASMQQQQRQPQPPPKQQQEQQQQSLDAAPQPQSPAQLFAGLDAVRPLVRSGSPLQSSQLHQTVSEAQHQVAGLVSSLYDSPSTGKPLAALSPGRPAPPLTNPARPALQLATAPADAPSGKAGTLVASIAAEQAAAAAALLGQASMPAAGAASEDRTAAAGQATAGQGGPPPAVAAVEDPPPEQAGPRQEAEAQEQLAGPQEGGGGGTQQEWADATALLLGGSQGDEDFQDAEEGAAGGEDALQEAAVEAGLGGSQAAPG